MGPNIAAATWAALRAVPSALKLASKAHGQLSNVKRSPAAVEKTLKHELSKAMPGFAHLTGPQAHASPAPQAPGRRRAQSEPPRPSARASQALSQATPHLAALGKSPGLFKSAWHGFQAMRALRGSARELSKMDLHASLAPLGIDAGGGNRQAAHPPGAQLSIMIGHGRTEADGARPGRSHALGFAADLGQHGALRVHVAMLHGSTHQGPGTHRMAALIFDTRGMGAPRGGRARSRSEGARSPTFEAFHAAFGAASRSAEHIRQSARAPRASGINAFSMSIGIHGGAVAFSLHAHAMPSPRTRRASI